MGISFGSYFQRFERCFQHVATGTVRAGVNMIGVRRLRITEPLEGDRKCVGGGATRPITLGNMRSFGPHLLDVACRA